MPDAHQGGRLEDLAVTGTEIPGDAGVQRLIPSVPRPDQISENSTAFNKGDIAAGDLARAADNATDMPRQPKDMGQTGEVITGTGDALPAQIESKRLHFGANDTLSKGHDRYDKHRAQNESDFERYQGRVPLQLLLQARKAMVRMPSVIGRVCEEESIHIIKEV